MRLISTWPQFSRLPVEALADDECATERLRAKNGYPGRVRTRQIHPVAERMSTLAERHQVFRR